MQQSAAYLQIAGQMKCVRCYMGGRSVLAAMLHFCRSVPAATCKATLICSTVQSADGGSSISHAQQWHLGQQLRLVNRLCEGEDYDM